ncbi:MAG TPA: histidine kinase dimerization/phosphoacceptor domain -containing protein [Bacteroidia bacterium]|nr:histidine kinase dimerization/phosphoacceptor domain -containing protein [Bacteroidia bacterium]
MNSSYQHKIKELEKEISFLKKENQKLKILKKHVGKPTVKVPKPIQPAFNKAEKLVGDYFSSLKFNPSEGRIEIDNERYILVRASALSHEFLNSIKHLYKDRGDEQALSIGKNILFDLSHVLGLEDARSFHKKMKLKDPISKLSAGPVHFAYAGWASVDILPESHPTPDEDFFITYHHPYSFEADSWIKSGKKSETPVCIMNAGYSSGWTEASFDMPLTAVEISCRAKGDKHCTFIMAPPHKIDSYLPKNTKKNNKHAIEIPSFLEQKKIEEELNSSLAEKEFLLKEIHHRVKNNLQIISSLLNLQAQSIDDPFVKEKYNESIGRIKSMAIIHELLYRSKNLSTIEIKDYLNELVSYITSTYNVDKNITVTLKVKVQQKFIELDKAIPCGIIINELLSNAFKYAFKNKKKGTINISFKEVEKQYSLIVSDNGVGFAEADNLKQVDTLGLQLVNALIGQLGGTLRTETQKGTTFNISFS